MNFVYVISLICMLAVSTFGVGTNQHVIKIQEKRKNALVFMSAEEKLCRAFWDKNFITAEGTYLNKIIGDFAAAASSSDSRPAFCKKKEGKIYVEYKLQNVVLSGLLDMYGRNFVLLAKSSDDKVCNHDTPMILAKDETPAAILKGNDETIYATNRGTLRAYIHNNSLFLETKYEGNAATIEAIRWTKLGDIPVGICKEVYLPDHDEGYNRKYLEAPIRSTLLDYELDISFSRSNLKKRQRFEAHSHGNDDVRIIVSGNYRFNIIENGNITKTFTAVPGDVVSIPAHTTYVEEVLESGTVVTGRTYTSLHYANYEYKVEGETYKMHPASRAAAAL